MWSLVHAERTPGDRRRAAANAPDDALEVERQARASARHVLDLIEAEADRLDDDLVGRVRQLARALVLLELTLPADVRDDLCLETRMDHPFAQLAAEWSRWIAKIADDANPTLVARGWEHRRRRTALYVAKTCAHLPTAVAERALAAAALEDTTTRRSESTPAETLLARCDRLCDQAPSVASVATLRRSLAWAVADRSRLGLSRHDCDELARVHDELTGHLTGESTNATEIERSIQHARVVVADVVADEIACTQGHLSLSA